MSVKRGKCRVMVTLSTFNWDVLDRQCKFLGVKKSVIFERALKARYLPSLKQSKGVSREDMRKLKADIYMYPSQKIALTLDCQLAERISKACKQKNIPRDYFFNQFLEEFTSEFDMVVESFESIFDESEPPLGRFTNQSNKTITENSNRMNFFDSKIEDTLKILDDTLKQQQVRRDEKS